ncbi:hypothetical protein G7Z17_g11863 [Cylindrodendrum hubeiense]|uniref:WW domain-containing protein n=1 Tax=Cylindrodendrum hubeiense TaxID=595255 RepID=A0A9P5H346_9HYPO|nr:hypothetical protein G7Z17_g11863 [Cylindrodendrum hubeiense]
MSFLNKFKDEFEGLNLGDRLQQGNSAGQIPANNHGYSATSQSYGYDQQSHSNNPYPNQPYTAQGVNPSGQQSQQASYQPYNPGQQSQYAAYQPGQQPIHDGPQSGVHQPYNATQQPYGQGALGFNATTQQLQPPSPAPRPPSTHSAYQQLSLNPSPGGSSFVHSPPSAPSYYSGGQQILSPPSSYNATPQALTPYNTAPHAPSNLSPTPPSWVPYWSEHDRRWYFAETTGRSSWEAPSDLAPLPSMPAYSGFQGKRGSTIITATGGLIAGGVAGYFIHDALDKRKKKKRHGRTPGDFSDFGSYPGLATNLQCNICNRDVYGPYAHCAKCDDGDYDICRNCLAQGIICEGKGKHRLIKVYPEYECNICGHDIQGDFYHCGICDNGEWDICQPCLDRGKSCNADGGHRLVKLYLPLPNYGPGKHSANSDSSSSSDSD